MPLFRREESSTAAVGGLETVLGSTTNLKGVLKSDGNIRIDGVLQGTIETAGNLVVGPSARVVADIRANAVQVWGQIQGNIQTAGRLEILSSGRVFGEVTVGSLMIDEGGLFRGQCFMDGQDVDELLVSGEPRLLAAGNDGEIVDGASSRTREGNGGDDTESDQDPGESPDEETAEDGDEASDGDQVSDHSDPMADGV